jgi:hypothetical protein
VVAAIIALARSLGLRVIAEGVETIMQMNVLQGLGCDLMQGYLFARPMPADDLAAWWHQRVDGVHPASDEPISLIGVTPLPPVPVLSPALPVDDRLVAVAVAPADTATRTRAPRAQGA